MTVEHDITEAIPLPLSGRTNPNSAQFRVSKDAFDVAIGDLPFLVYISAEHPYERSTAPIRKEQFDAERNVGEQSLTGWWLRSQADFSGGMGITFYEPLLGEGSENRFIDSRGLNVFDHDEVRLLNQQAVARAGGSDLELVGVGESGALYRNGAEFRMIHASTTTAVSPGGIDPRGIARIPGFNWLIGHSTGIRRMNSSGTSAPVVTGASAPLTPYWAKDRIFATQGRKIYECPLQDNRAIDETVAGDLIYEHPTSSWTWVSIVETGAAVWLAGRASAASSIYVTTVDNSEPASPRLAPVTSAIELPAGEYVTCMSAYLGFLLIGTNLGFRVAITDADRAQLGPLLWRDEAAKSVTARGDYAWVGLANGLTRRVALGITTSTDELDFAYANDAEVSRGGDVVAVGFINDKLVTATNDVGATRESSNLVESGWMRTGFSRYGTLEPKYFESVMLMGDVSSGSVSVAAAITADSYVPVTSLGAFNGTQEMALTLPGGSPPWEKLSLEITLSRGSATTGPKFEGYQLRALPAPKRRQRLLSVPLLCYDRERKNGGTTRGSEGFAFARIQDLEALEDSGVPVVYKDFRTGEARNVVVDQVHYTGIAPPDRNHTGFGGMITATLRAVS